MRLDIYLTENKIYGSRTRARRAVEAGCVSVNGMTVMKASYDVTKSDVVSADSDPVPYVSRGAFKLLHGLEMFSVNIDGAVALDVGASTGGFTEVMLKRGAARVYAVDVGRGQLDAGLAADPRVVNMEATDIRSLTGRGFENFFDFTACDASFISLTYILPVCAGLMKEGADGIFLIKPQFEAGRDKIGKGGIVKDDKVIDYVIDKITAFAKCCDFELVTPIIPSPVCGGDGNREFLMRLRRKAAAV